MWRTIALKAAGEKEGDRQDKRDQRAHPNRGGQHPCSTKRVRAYLKEEESAAVTRWGPVRCQPFDNRKCGNNQKCMKTQGRRLAREDRLVLAKPSQDKLSYLSWEIREKMNRGSKTWEETVC